MIFVEICTFLVVSVSIFSVFTMPVMERNTTLRTPINLYAEHLTKKDLVKKYRSKNRLSKTKFIDPFMFVPILPDPLLSSGPTPANQLPTPDTIAFTAAISALAYIVQPHLLLFCQLLARLACPPPHHVVRH